MQKRRLSKSELSRRGFHARAPRSASALTSEPDDASRGSVGERLLAVPLGPPVGRIDMREFIRRLGARLEKRGLTAHAAALRAGLSPSQIGTMRRQYELGQQHGVSIRTVARLAAALATTPEWLLSGTGPEEAPETGADETADRTPRDTSPQTCQALPRQNQQPSSQSVGLPIAGSVAAGVWVEPATGNIGPQFAVIPADPRYPAQHQSAWEVRDNSIDRVARPGDFLIVVDRLAAELPLRTGDLVIVTRQKSDLHEITSRRFAAEFDTWPARLPT